MSLTQENIDTYLTQVLKYKNWKEDFENFNNHGFYFISKVFQSWLVNIPFHNIGILEESEDLEFYSEQEIIDKVLEGKSVMCAGNVFLKCLFCSLGFNSFLIKSILNLRAVMNSAGETSVKGRSTIIHLTFGIKHPVTNVTYFLDIGSGLVITEPIPLNALPYRNTVGGFTYEIQSTDSSNQSFQLVEIDGNLITGNFNGGTNENVRYTFDGKPIEFQDVAEDIQVAIETTSTCCKFLSLSRFTFIRSKEDFKFISICGSWIVIVEGETKRNVIRVKDLSQMSSFILSTFPDLKIRKEFILGLNQM